MPRTRDARRPRPSPKAAEPRWGRAGRWGLALLALHTMLLFFPPIPPIHRGSSVPGYALSLAVVTLLAIELARRATALIEGWRAQASSGRRALVASVACGLLAGAFALRAAAPEVFRRFSREEGLWEPVTLVCYLAGAILLWRAAAGADEDERKPWRLLAGLYVWFAAEELDYFGIPGALIGRIRGEYAGALHDIVRLAALGIVGVVAWAILIAAAAGVLALLWRAGYLPPSWIAARLADRRILWAMAGLAFLWAAAAEEAHVFGWIFAMPTPEEAIELVGGFLLAVYALEAAAGATAR